MRDVEAGRVPIIFTENETVDEERVMMIKKILDGFNFICK